MKKKFSLDQNGTKHPKRAAKMERYIQIEIFSKNTIFFRKSWKNFKNRKKCSEKFKKIQSAYANPIRKEITIQISL